MGKPIRRSDGGLVDASAFAEIEETQVPNPQQPDLWHAAGSPGYGRGWSNPDQDIPREPSAGRSEVLTTDRDLQTGPEPGRITRIADTRASGLIAPQAVNTFPVDGNWGYIRHQPIGKLVQGAVPQLKTIADDAWVGAVFAGNPVQ